MSYQHRTPEELDRAAFADECARHEQDLMGKQEALHHEEICRLKAQLASAKADKLAVASLLASAAMHISSWYIDWAKLNRDSPDYDPAYDPTPDFPEIVGELNAAVTKLREE